MTQNNTHNSNKPTHGVYNVIESSSGGKANWQKVGSAWTHRDGQGLNLKLNAIPFTGELVIRVQTDKPAEH